ncbi:hypothetical protein SmJEL517_g01149 [Synchytrium microbalum]|uniref:Ubiquitin carboxyl-terminal hydrolase n=1 Tax=Synchytrium microbalum TaxID=1806994 RepID=A0A507CGT7_9FUNG|nr:uncharacterized protein SmJEL517_g01149 [Synchytrium microbalum]TPX36743.1 hypothetical protein SmJEL517_g01149 [Synchytrium microbalum]
MPVVKVSVKWSGKKFDNVEVDTSQPGIVFKTQLFSLTGVEPDRQKIMIKGGMLKDDTDLSKLDLKEGHSFMMMGTAGELPKAPEKPIQFVEDMTDAQIAQAMKLPAGLVNLGNTCYMNATLQCLRTIPELQTAMSRMTGSISPDFRASLPVSLKTLYRELSSSGEAIPPLVFLQMLRGAFPQFAEQTARGFSQQDAEECWGQIVSSLKESVPGLTATGEVNPGIHFVDQFMNGQFASTLKCDDAPQEEATVSTEGFTRLQVNIGSGVSTYLSSDISSGLTQKIEKNSPTLNTLAKYTKTSKISRLPAYLTINFVRFQWKPATEPGGSGTRAKILKKVKFPFELDMAQFVTPDLLAKLAPARDRLKEMDDYKSAVKKLKTKKVSDAQAALAAGTATTAMDIDTPATASSAAAASTKTTRSQKEVLTELGVDASLINDVGCNVSGWYDLVAVLTHVGRAADSGHYIAWTRRESNQDGTSSEPDDGLGWWKFDDDKVSPVSADEITKLEGGGDWHTAYICLYRAKPLGDKPPPLEP